MIVIRSFSKFVKEIWEDIMLAAMLFVPVLMGIAFRFVIPVVEKEICDALNCTEYLEPYYMIFDLVLIITTPIMFVYSGVMVMLGEIDNGIAKYLVVTPLGKSGYVISRVGISAVIATVYSFVLVITFHISDISLINMFICSLIAGFTGILISFFIVAIAHNKVEGMALTKFSSFLLIGLIVPFFLKVPMNYIASFLPTFWVTEYCRSGNVMWVVVSIAESCLYSYIFYRKFCSKLR